MAKEEDRPGTLNSDRNCRTWCEAQHIAVPYARKHGIAICPIDWLPSRDDGRLAFGRRERSCRQSSPLAFARSSQTISLAISRPFTMPQRSVLGCAVPCVV